VQLLGKTFARAFLYACVSLLVVSAAASGADYEQNFDSLASSGWTTTMLSTSPPYSGWAQGQVAEGGAPYSHSGAPNSYVEDHGWGAGAVDPFDDWLISPHFSDLSNGDVARFWMRNQNGWFAEPPGQALELRLATGVACSPTSAAGPAGDFTTKLLAFDPQNWAGPVSTQEWMNHAVRPPWTEQAAVISGLPEGEHSGCLALHRVAPTLHWTVSYLAIDDFRLTGRAATAGEIAFFDHLPAGTELRTYPAIRGRADTGSSVAVFTNSDCSGTPYTTVGSDQFDWPGVNINVPDQASTEISANSTDSSGNVSDCAQYGKIDLLDTFPPVTTDDVGNGATTYPGPVKLTATDVGVGLGITRYTVGENPETPVWGSARYDAANPPVLQPGWRISYFSTDKLGNLEEVKTSNPAPFPEPDDPKQAGSPTPPTGDVVAQSTKLGRVRVGSESLLARSGQVAIRLTCSGESGASPCAGEVSIRASFGSTETSISRKQVKVSVPFGVRKSVPVKLTRSALKRLAGAGRGGTWVRVVLKTGDSTPASFRRKLHLQTT
jgi:hypothetical protein